MNIASMLIVAFGIIIAVAIGKRCLNAANFELRVITLSLMELCIIGMIVFPLYFVLVVLIVKYTGLQISMIKVGVIKFSAFMTLVSLLIPTTEGLADRYL